MSATPPTAGDPPPPVATPPEASPPEIAPPPVIIPPAAPPVDATPPVVPPSVVPPPVLPPVAPTPAVLPPASEVSPPPPVVSPPPPVVFPPPPVVSQPPPVVSQPPPMVSQPPPVESPPSPVISPPPTVTPPSPSPPVVTPDASPPPMSPPSQGSVPSPPSPPPPEDNAPSPPGTRAPPPASVPPPVVLNPPGSSRIPPPPPAALGPSTPSENQISVGAIVGIVAGGGLLALLALVLIIVFCRKRKNKKNVLPHAVAGGVGGGGGAVFVGTAHKAGGMDDPKAYGAGGNARLPPGSHGGVVPLPPEGSPSVGNSRSWFTYDELHAATNGFANENLLGEGGFGRVFKGELLNGQVVAVKQLTVGGGQGDREFRAEVEIISRVHHRHLVSLVGYCIADKQRLLVYDFVPNGTLDVNLYGNGKLIMNWEKRVRVALGAARGLAYLHEDCHPRIIHRDIKSSNILLDDKYEAQVADFGLAKLVSDTNTHVSTRVMGTFGYLAPEYAQSGKLTEKSDVYSFGVVLLELITGRKPIDQRNPIGQESLVEWARPLMTYAMEDGDLDDLVDPRLDSNYDSKEMFRMIEVAASCVRHSASKRPKMGQVVRALESEEENAGLYTSLRPGMSSEHESDFDRYTGSDYDTQAFNADILRSRGAAGASTKSYGSKDSNEFIFGQIERGSSSEFEPIISKPEESRINVRESGPMSVRTGRSSMPSIHGGRTMDSYTNLPPTRTAPPRSGQASDNDKSKSIRSNMFMPPPPPPNLSEEYASIDFNPSIHEGQ